MAKSDLVSARRHAAGFLEARAAAESGPRGEVLAGFLQSDVQADLATARAFLAEVAAAARGDPPQPGGVGNAFATTITPAGATIRNALIEGATPQNYSLGELQAALETWIEAIEQARRDGNVQF
jgi:hypothetical protein